MKKVPKQVYIEGNTSKGVRRLNINSSPNKYRQKEVEENFTRPVSFSDLCIYLLPVKYLVFL